MAQQSRCTNASLEGRDKISGLMYDFAKVVSNYIHVSPIVQLQFGQNSLVGAAQGLIKQAWATQASPVRVQSARPTRRASMAFMEMLRGARDPPVSTQLTWAEASLQLQGDLRYEAVAEEQRVQMYETFLEALAKVEASKLQRRTERAAADFKVWPFAGCCPLS